MSGSVQYYEGLAAQDASQFGIPQTLFLDQIGQESGFNPNAVNGEAAGIAQFIPSTASEYGVSDPYDAASALAGAAQYDANLYQKTGSWAQTLADYGTTANGDAPALASYASQLDQDGTGLGSEYSGANLYLAGAYTPGESQIIANNGGYAGTAANVRNDSRGGLDILGSAEAWLTSHVGNILAVVVGVVILAGGLFLLGGDRTITLAAPEGS